MQRIREEYREKSDFLNIFLIFLLIAVTSAWHMLLLPTNGRLIKGNVILEADEGKEAEFIKSRIFLDDGKDKKDLITF